MPPGTTGHIAIGPVVLVELEPCLWNIKSKWNVYHYWIIGGPKLDYPNSHKIDHLQLNLKEQLGLTIWHITAGKNKYSNGCKVPWFLHTIVELWVAEHFMMGLGATIKYLLASPIWPIQQGLHDCHKSVPASCTSPRSPAGSWRYCPPTPLQQGLDRITCLVVALTTDWRTTDGNWQLPLESQLCRT